MHKIYIIPDVHCRPFYKPVLNIKDELVVFLGDYLDPYHYEGFSDAQGLENLEEIIEFARNNKNVTLLVGNHDLNEIFSPIVCFRTEEKYYEPAHKLFRDNIDLFSIAKKIDNTIFTHAGLCAGWIDMMNKRFKHAGNDFKLTEDNIVDYLNKEFSIELEHDKAVSYGFSSFLHSDIFCVGRDRGGEAPYGGPLWCDFHYGFYPSKDWIGFQIFGHTQSYETGLVRTRVSGVCLDSRAIFEYYPETRLIVPSKINTDETKKQIEDNYWKGDTLCTSKEYERSIEERVRNYSNKNS